MIGVILVTMTLSGTEVGVVRTWAFNSLDGCRNELKTALYNSASNGKVIFKDSNKFVIDQGGSDKFIARCVFDGTWIFPGSEG